MTEQRNESSAAKERLEREWGDRYEQDAKDEASAAQAHEPPEFEPYFDDDCVCSRKVARDHAASMWKSSFTRSEWLAGIVLGAFMGALILLIVWLLVGEPRV